MGWTSKHDGNKLSPPPKEAAVNTPEMSCNIAVISYPEASQNSSLACPQCLRATAWFDTLWRTEV